MTNMIHTMDLTKPQSNHHKYNQQPKTQSQKDTNTQETTISSTTQNSHDKVIEFRELIRKNSKL